jgi:serine/threonine protein kinase
VTDTTTSRAGSHPCPDDVVLDRYRLVDRAGEKSESTLWRGFDQRLARPVSIRLAPLDSPIAPRLREAAVAASRVTDRRAVPILDIVDDDESGQLVIVTEWLAGTFFGEYLAARHGEPLPPREAATLALEVARFLSSAEASGVTHAHLRPNAVMITDSGEVRVRGLAIDQALHGVEPAVDPVLADVHGAGAVLFAGLTGRWPGALDDSRLPDVPTLGGGRTPWPSRVVADVPSDLDEIAARALQTTHPPKGLGHFVNVADVAEALAASLVRAPHVPVRRGVGRAVLRVAAVATVLLAALGLAGLGLNMIRGLGGDPLTVTRVATSSTASAPAPTPTASTPGPAADQVLPIVSVADFDPYGGDKHENSSEAPLADDDNPATAWYTVHYRAPDLSGKPGVGLLVDLGAPRPVDAVSLRLAGIGTNLSLLATDDPAAPVASFTTMAQVVGAGTSVTIRVPRPVTTRYLVVWLTGLPPIDGAYQGGIADIKVLG